MGRVFGKVSVWFRLKYYFIDTFNQIIALPSYINPKPLKPAPLTEEELKLLEEIDE